MGRQLGGGASSTHILPTGATAHPLQGSEPPSPIPSPSPTWPTAYRQQQWPLGDLGPHGTASSRDMGQWGAPQFGAAHLAPDAASPTSRRCSPSWCSAMWCCAPLGHMGCHPGPHATGRDCLSCWAGSCVHGSVTTQQCMGRTCRIRPSMTGIPCKWHGVLGDSPSGPKVHGAAQHCTELGCTSVMR